MNTKNEKIKEQIRAALAGQRSGITSLDIRERSEITDAPRCMSVLTAMAAAGEIIKHEGASPRKSTYTLNPEYSSGTTEAVAPKSTKKRAAGKKTKKRKAGKARKPREQKVELLTIDQEFIPALTVDHCLVLFTKGMSPPQMFTPDQTVAIATLTRDNFA